MHPVDRRQPGATPPEYRSWRNRAPPFPVPQETDSQETIGPSPFDRLGFFFDRAKRSENRRLLFGRKHHFATLRLVGLRCLFRPRAAPNLLFGADTWEGWMPPCALRCFAPILRLDWPLSRHSGPIACLFPPPDDRCRQTLDQGADRRPLRGSYG